MQRRDVIKAGATLAATTAMPIRVAALDHPSMRQFEVTTTVEIAAPAAGLQLWLPVFGSNAAYQKRLAAAWDGTGSGRLRSDASGAELLHVRWSDGAQPQRVTLVQRLATWERTRPVAKPVLGGAERARWTASTAAIPTDGIVAETAQRIVGSEREPRARLAALYDWVAANTWRDAATAGCGRGEVASMLRSGRLGGKCVDISRLLVALARAVGLPARDVYGIRLAPSKLSPSLGKGPVITGAQHCRAEVWLDDAGWFAVDPADVRKAILEDKLDPAGADVARLKAHLFGAWEDNWGGYNSASGIALPGAITPARFDFLMYPTAIGASGSADCLDPAHFTYRIESREIIA
ncbi:MAG: transglutaminase family protein [Novosphingobium sp.]|nr:transglutaminase family protein [Novosphingobium sp.]